MGRREIILLSALVWVVLAAFGALPFVLGGPANSYADGYFETLSGLTTTGLTVFRDPATLDRSLLIWRAMLQWLGGLATIVLAVAVLPYLGLGGVQVRQGDSAQRVGQALRPGLRQAARTLSFAYGMLTGLCLVALLIAGMPPLDAVCHAMSTISTGGFSTHAAPMDAFRRPAIEIVLIVFMLLGALNFALHGPALGGRLSVYRRDSECRLMLVIVTLATAGTALYLTGIGQFDAGEAVRRGLFDVVSAITTTGYAGPAAGAGLNVLVFVMLGLAVIGGATGSTAGGLKLMRWLLLLRQSGRELVRLTRPHGVVPVRYGGASVSSAVVQSVWGVFVAYMFSLVVLAIGLAAFGIAFPAALALAVSSLANAGPGVAGSGGVAVEIAGLATGAKGLIGLGMVAGRLELLAMLVLLNPMFWRN